MFDPVNWGFGACFLTLAVFLAAHCYHQALQAFIAVSDWRHRKAKLAVDAVLAGHGLSSDLILKTLLGFDYFSFVLDGHVCTCVKRDDGTYDFGFPTPRAVEAVLRGEPSGVTTEVES